MSVEERFTIAVIGAGSAATSFITEMSGSGHSIVVFEPKLVGGECPFLACIPSKSMLHDRSTGRSWSEAVARRDELVSHLDDSSHAEPLREAGATIIRERAKIVGPGQVSAGDATYAVDHIVIATGAEPVFPDIDGLDRDYHRVWTHRDVLTSTEQPASIVVLGGGVIGSELAFMYAGFGTDATTIDEAERPADDLHPRVSEIMAEVLEDGGVRVINRAKAVRVEASDDDVTVHTDDGRAFTAERLLVAVGRRPDLSQLGLDAVGVDPEDVEIDETGRLIGTVGEAHLWVAGDAAGRAQYTHLANQHGVVIADQIAGKAERTLSDVVIPACIFIDPPVMIIGATYADAPSDLLWAEVDIETPRHNTDEHRQGFIAAAVDPASGCVVAAHGIGAGIDELSHALVVAIAGEVPVSTLQRTIQPFPTLGGALADVYDELARVLSDNQSRP